MEETGCFFPQAHLDPEIMAGLAVAGYERLGYDTIAPVFSTQHEADALGCAVDWGRLDMMPDVTRHPCRTAEDIRIPADFLRHPALTVVLDCLHLLRRRYGQEVVLIGNVNDPRTLLHGTPEDVRREVGEILAAGIEIVAPECAVPLTTPTENLRAVVEGVVGVGRAF